MVSVRAVYRDGQLQPLDPLELEEGEEVRLHISKPSGNLAEVVADLLVPFTAEPGEFDETLVQQQLDAALTGKRPLSEIIIEARHEGE